MKQQYTTLLPLNGIKGGRKTTCMACQQKKPKKLGVKCFVVNGPRCTSDFYFQLILGLLEMASPIAKTFGMFEADSLSLLLEALGKLKHIQKVSIIRSELLLAGIITKIFIFEPIYCGIVFSICHILG